MMTKDQERGKRVREMYEKMHEQSEESVNEIRGRLEDVERSNAELQKEERKRKSNPIPRGGSSFATPARSTAIGKKKSLGFPHKGER